MTRTQGQRREANPPQNGQGRLSLFPTGRCLSLRRLDQSLSLLDVLLRSLSGAIAGRDGQEGGHGKAAGDKSQNPGDDHQPPSGSVADSSFDHGQHDDRWVVQPIPLDEETQLGGGPYRTSGRLITSG